ncbi:hypothetical protein YC2023_103415 [Brassica napus]
MNQGSKRGLGGYDDAQQPYVVTSLMMVRHNEEQRNQRTENGCKNGEADEQDFRTEKMMSS